MTARKRERWLLIAVLVCVGALAGDRLLIGPLWSGWKDRTERIAQVKADLENGETLLDRREAIESRWKEMQQIALPTEAAQAEDRVLNVISDWAGTSRIIVESLKPRWIEDADEAHYELEIRITGKGRLESVTRFLYEMETDSLPVRLRDVELSSRDDSGREIAMSARFSSVILKEKKQ